MEAFREAVAAIREGLLQLPLKAAMVQLLKLVGLQCLLCQLCMLDTLWRCPYQRGAQCA